MSRSHKENIKCPNCDNAQMIEIWDSVNASADPNLKEQLIQGELTTTVCTKCKKTFFVKYDMIYHDPDEKVMLLLRYPDENGNVSEFDKDSLELIKAMADDYILRSVYSFPDLLEKIRIFDDDFDDVSIEILKYMSRLTNNLEPDEMILYEGINVDDQGEEHLILIRPVGSEFLAYHYPVYELDILDEPRQHIDINKLKEKDNVWIRVDQETITDQLTAHND
ncbi:MAG: CpXC domain-containing protein [Candidatus Marinimicrobia bacterium]|nr:CpXC domain-containing protein [Candidatus Neomarinimicrobiota bacterium]